MAKDKTVKLTTAKPRVHHTSKPSRLKPNTKKKLVVITQMEGAGIRRVLSLCEDFLNQTHKDDPLFAVDGGLWTKTELLQHIAAAKELIPKTPQ